MNYWTPTCWPRKYIQMAGDRKRCISKEYLRVSARLPLSQRNGKRTNNQPVCLVFTGLQAHKAHKAHKADLGTISGFRHNSNTSRANVCFREGGHSQGCRFYYADFTSPQIFANSDDAGVAQPAGTVISGAKPPSLPADCTEKISSSRLKVLLDSRSLSSIKNQ